VVEITPNVPVFAAAVAIEERQPEQKFNNYSKAKINYK
jgi:hypothetical protein